MADKIDADLQEALDSDPRVDFWVRFGDRPDMTRFAGISGWDARGHAVYEALTDTARASQAGAVSTLEQQGAAYRSYWITNAIRVTGGTEELALSLAGDSRVDGLYAVNTYELPDLEPVEPADVGPAAVEWGIADINADDVWADFGITGEEIVVASIDTGVQYDHPALVNQYRGNLGDGTFDHDYSWFDASGSSPEEPVDFEGHGSHVTGTMVGSDGGDNQIGVAPGATWISANGCCPSDEALIASGEWMLAPTRIDGSDPDPSMRPHVINNSWGSTFPSNDPFMEDISEAWAAAGQFGVWANGNSGPQCETSGSPGSRIINYSVGNYDANHVINPSSGRGPGQDGSIKPNIAAPGTSVRSAVPGNGYDWYSGTSMASPHVAGAIALMWASSPALIGDIETTWDLLNGTAIDTEDLQCGGTAENNNVFGEGRLDAHALVSAAPRGDVGYLEGVVTDATTGEPLPAAQVTIEGELERTVRTNSQGAYRALVTAGEYQVSAEKFGWISQTEPVTVPAEETVVQDFALERSLSGTVSGTVTDGSGQGYPLYARVLVTGTDLFTYTDPADGSYTLDVPLDTPVRINVEVQYPGYTVVSDDVVLTGDLTHDVAVPVDAVSCTANGYEVNVDGLTETFDDGTQPPGWTVEDILDNGQVWVFDDPAGRGNLTGGEGGFAIVDSDWYGPEGVQNTALVSPPVDMSEVGSPTLGFRQMYEPINDVADVDVSVDGGVEWTTVASYTTPQEGLTILPLPMAQDQSDVRVRFHYYGAEWAWFWQVDDVFLGNRTCDPVGEGGYVFGNVSSSLQDAPIRGARVTSLDNPSDTGVTVDTPADQGQDDGFYWLFSNLAGEHPFEASARSYTSLVQDVTVPDGGAVRADFVLGGGLLTLDPPSINTEVTLGEPATEELTVTNEGDDVVDIELQEVRGDFDMLRADGTRMTASQAREMTGAPDRRVDAPTSYAASPGRATGQQPAAQGPAEEPWEMLASYPTAVMDHRMVTLDGQWYVIGGGDGFELTDAVRRYDPAGMEWVEVAPLPVPLQAMTAGVVDGQIVVSGGWTTDGTTTGDTYVYDAAADEWSQVADNPSTVSAAGQAVLDGQLYSVGGCSTGECEPMSRTVTAYDPGADSWSTVADYPVSVAFASCGGVAGQLYCTGGTNEMAELSSTYAYDPASDSWSEVAEAPAPWWASSHAVANGMLVVSGGVVMGDLSNETWGYDPAQDTWVDLPNPNTANYRGAASCGLVRVGGAEGFEPTDVVEYLPGFDDCGSVTDVPWLSLSQYEATLAPGESVTVQVTTDGTVPQPGDYTAGIRAVGGVPGSDPVTEVTMTVLPPATWGKLAGTVQGESCTGDLSPLGGATVDATPTRVPQPRWRLVTDTEGQYAQWIDTRVGELEMIASANQHLPDSARVTPRRGVVTVQDFDLLHASCEAPPGPIHPDVFRIQGTDRYGTAAAVSQRFEPGVETVFVVTGRSYPDALAAAARAGSLGSPVLLTRQGSLPSATSVELRRLAPQEVVVVGGTQAVDDRVIRAIDVVTDAPIRRVTGSDRYVTAANLAAEFESSEVVFVATGRDYPDALAGASRAGALDAPVLLVRTGSVPAATHRELARLAPDQIVLLGGTTAVTSGVQEALGQYGTVTRIAGTDRYRTAAAVAQAYPSADTTYVASGQNWPDALAGAALAGHEEVPMLLVRNNSVPGATWSSLERLQPGRIPVLGGPVAVQEVILDQLRTLE
ncbi:cell wall-binding repeat-containing protein [Ornithinimicrobium pratense]|uniref:cell wall-binding repeat-containing protein n=1 Tax=Ornithinimicrobium pratense TaxID=2593973 RepID=UPI001EE1E077|nr:cell wall-binding repeat-containing protein [Ornithinimicrobium pratense]